MNRIALTGAFLLSSLLSLNLLAAAAPTPEEQAAKATADRQAVFKLLSVSNAPVGAMARPGGTYDADIAKRGLERVAMLAGMIPELFAMDTTSYSSLTTRASDTIWANKADFEQLAMDLAAGATAAMEILNTQGAAGIAAAGREVGTKCGACHDRFRLD